MATCVTPDQFRNITGKFVRSGTVPVVPSSGCPVDGTLEIENAEIVTNITDGRVFVRANNRIIELTNQSSIGAGTVTSVATVGLISGGPITTTGTITTSMATNKLVGRGTAGTGIMEEITLGTGLALTGTTLDVTIPAPTLTATQIGFGSGANLLTGSADFTWDDTSKNFVITGTIGQLLSNSNNVWYVAQGDAGFWFTGATSTGLLGHRGFGMDLKTNQIYTMGDAVSGSGNGTYIQVNDTAQTITLTHGSSLTLGTVTSGLWNGTVIGKTYGGTGVDISTTALTLGTASSANGSLVLHSSANAFTTTINTGVTGASYTLTLPTTNGAPNEFLQTDGNGVLTWAAAGGTVAISALTAAAATNTINNADFAQEWQWSTLSSNTGLHLSSSSTAAAANTQTLFKATLTGATVTNGQTTYAGYFSNNHTNAASGTNVALYAEARSATTENIGLYAALGGTQYIKITSSGTTNKSITFDNGAAADGLQLRNLTSTPNYLSLVGGGANSIPRFELRGGTVGNTLLYMEAGGANNTSIIDMYRGTTVGIRLVDNNSNDSYFNTNRGFMFGGTARSSTTAYVEIASTTSGFLQPRMTSAQWAAILTKAQGLSAFDTTVKSNVYVDASSGITHYIPSVIFSQTNTVTVANTVTETTILGTGTGTTTLDANDLTVGKNIHVKVRGIISDTGTPTIRIRVKLGATTIGDTGAIALSGTITDEEFDVDYMFTCRTTGATGTVIGSGFFSFDNAASAGATFGMPATGTTTIDTTAALALSVTVEWGAADPANTISSQVATIKMSA